MTPEQIAEPLSAEAPRKVCSRDGLWLSPKKDGGYKHNAARWTGVSCGETPDPITYIEYLEANPWLIRRR
jgi:hypothetical protein